MKRSLKKLSALLLLMGLFVLTGCAAKETLPNEEVYQGKLRQLCGDAGWYR